MITLFTTAVILSSSCAWNNPGDNPFSGNKIEAVDHYLDIPPEIRNVIKNRMRKHKYNEVVEIRKNSIGNPGEYQPIISGMHFGKNQLCSSVDRSKWKDTHVERGLVFCDMGYCIIVPTVCGNISRVFRVYNPEIPVSSIPSGGGFKLPPDYGGGYRLPQYDIPKNSYTNPRIAVD